MDGNDLAQRLKRWEDIDALQQLKYRYCRATDDNYDGELVASLFTEDGIWDGGTLGGLPLDLGRSYCRSSWRRRFLSE